jgi:hypothetical protein
MIGLPLDADWVTLAHPPGHDSLIGRSGRSPV